MEVDYTFSLGISETDIFNRIKQPPYQKVIENLHQLPKYRRPLDKMRVIGQSSALIVKSVDEFWKGVEGVKPKDLSMDAD